METTRITLEEMVGAGYRTGALDEFTYEPSAEFIAEAVRRAEEAGYYPAEIQRAVDWAQVLAWSIRVQQPGFVWTDAEDRATDAILVGPGPYGRSAIHSGQHRILGGLMGGNPVPQACMLLLYVPDRTRGWHEAPRTLDLCDLLV